MSTTAQPLARYHLVSRWFHWALVALIALEYPLAWSMSDHRGVPEDALASWHVGVGTTILGLFLLRLLWRWVRKPPPHPPMPAWQARAAQATHGLLYAGFVLLPLLGWMAASARAWPVHAMGLIQLPALFPASTTWAGLLGDAHQAVAIGLLGLIGLHIAAALFHTYILRDGSLRRML
ncbi:cytochrome b [Thiomonas intermedia]|uniref:cytochrome b n=1 Tax=Thiomonas intermedia TaxID=926 RepID=UPI0009A51D71|nr:cytochrome b/b6 domain-containing protein [Thiomonas intermedia]